MTRILEILCAIPAALAWFVIGIIVGFFSIFILLVEWLASRVERRRLRLESYDEALKRLQEGR